MPRPASKRAKIVALLRATGDPLSMAEIARAASCSEVYAWGVLRELGEQVEVAGRSRTGAKLFRWSEGAAGGDGSDQGSLRDPGDESPPMLDDVVRVVEARRISESEVELGLRRIGDGALFRARVRARGG
jgi:hypothetical protein